jgi:DNA-directed RNA polymerase specialized sigma24 family protein
MATDPCGSVTNLIGVLKSPGGGPASIDDAASELWARVSARLEALARKKMRSRPGMADEEDLALSAFHHFCREARAGKCEWVDDRNALWRLFVRITARKVSRFYRYMQQQRRDYRRMTNETDLPTADGDSQYAGSPLANIGGDALGPLEVAIVDDLLSKLLAALDDDMLLAVAQKKLEGYTNREIASALGVSGKSIERKMKIISNTWVRCGEGEAEEIEIGTGAGAGAAGGPAGGGPDGHGL